MLYLTLRQYEYVVAVAEKGSLTDAAVNLNVSQPSLSVAITRVEEQLGHALFVRRKGAAIITTPFGYRFVDQARELLKQATLIEQFSNTAPPFILGCFEDIAPWYLAKALDELNRHFPAMEIQGSEGRFSTLITDITQGRIDLAISYDIGFDKTFKRQKIKKVAPVAFVSTDHPLAEYSSLELHQLDDHQLILFTEDLSEGYVRHLFDGVNMEPNVVHKTASLEMMRSLAAHGSGVGISYSCPPSDSSYDGKPLVTLPISSPEAVADIVLVWSELRGTDQQFNEIVSVLQSI